MKIAFRLLLLCVIFLANFCLGNFYNSDHMNIIGASLDNNVMYIVVTAGVLGIAKLKKNTE